jgi:hypothetical protein
MTHYQAILLQTFVRFFVGIIKSYPHPVEKGRAQNFRGFFLYLRKGYLRSAKNPRPISGGMSN